MIANYSPTGQELLAGRMLSINGWSARVRSKKGRYVIWCCSHGHATPAAAVACARNYVEAYNPRSPK